MKSGKIYLIGAGPGDPGLFTIKGKMLLEQGEVVIYDRLVGEEILSYASPEDYYQMLSNLNMKPGVVDLETYNG